MWVPSTSDDVSGFITDIKMAQAAGIDGFAINTADWSAVNWAIPRCDKIWQAAETLNSGFKLFFSVDLTGSLGNMAGDILPRGHGRPLRQPTQHAQGHNHNF